MPPYTKQVLWTWEAAEVLGALVLLIAWIRAARCYESHLRRQLAWPARISGACLLLKLLLPLGSLVVPGSRLPPLSAPVAVLAWVSRQRGFVDLMLLASCLLMLRTLRTVRQVDRGALPNC